MTGPEEVIEARSLQKQSRPQTKVMVKKDEVKGDYLNELADPLSLKLLDL